MTLDMSDSCLFIFKPPSVVLLLHEESALLELLNQTVKCHLLKFKSEF